MRLKIGLNLIRNYSNNFSVLKRSKKDIKFIIIHYTGMKRESDAINRLCNPKSKVSSHYFIKNNGLIINLVPDIYEAWHAGKSYWKNFSLLNRYSLGIEINNPGHNFNYKDYSKKQIKSLIKLIQKLKLIYNIKKQNILGHSDIAPLRKKDPGEKFPWKKLAKKNLCIWHSLDKKKIRIYRNIRLSSTDEFIFFKHLNKIGYSQTKIKNLKFNKKNALIVKAFQRRFRQELVNGKLDKECFLIIKSLLKA